MNINRMHRSAVKIIVKTMLCTMIVGFLLSMTEFDAQSRAISNDVVRLHIIANSDSEEDQRLKLLVRDSVRRVCADMFPSGCQKQQAQTIIAEKLPEIVETARQTLRENGCGDGVRGELVNMYFTTRDYGSAAFPAGNYDALRLTIGSGEGHNWWCVVFPPMCVGAACDFSDVLTEEESSLVTGGVQYKFKVYEIYEELADRLAKRE